MTCAAMCGDVTWRGRALRTYGTTVRTRKCGRAGRSIAPLVLALHGLPSLERVRTCMPIPTQKETQSLVLYVNLCDGGHPDAFRSGVHPHSSRVRDHGLRCYSDVTVHLTFPANVQRTRTGSGSLNPQSIFSLENRVDSFTVVLYPRGVRDPGREPFDEAMAILCPYPMD